MIRYRKGYKYQLAADYYHYLRVPTGVYVLTDFVNLTDDLLWVKKGYAWDGASGPTIDTPASMRGSLVHDALYQLMSEGKLGAYYRQHADAELERTCVDDGMSRIRAFVWERGVNLFGARHATKSSGVLQAP